MQRRFLSILGITLIIALFIPQIIFAEDYDVNEDSYIDEKSSDWQEYLEELNIDKLEDPIVGGTGCPDSDSIVFGQVNKQFVFKFLEYVAETDKYHYWEDKNCDVTLPIKMKEGYRIGIGKVTYHGSARIPKGGSGELRRDYFFDTDYSKTHVYKFPKKDGEYHSFQVVDGESAVVWSECGGWVNANIYTSIMAERPQYSYYTTQATMSLKSENFTLMIDPLTEPCE